MRIITHREHHLVSGGASLHKRGEMYYVNTASHDFFDLSVSNLLLSFKGQQCLTRPENSPSDVAYYEINESNYRNFGLSFFAVHSVANMSFYQFSFS